MYYYPKKLTSEQRKSIDEVLGKVSDCEIARTYGLFTAQIRRMRKSRKIPSFILKKFFSMLILDH